MNNSLSTDVNIGPNTLPGSFKFSNNLWYHDANAGWRGPQLPVAESMGLVQRNPLFVQDGGINYGIGTTSPAFKAGLKQAIVFSDYRSRSYRNPPSIGAMEVPVQTQTLAEPKQNVHPYFYPNPTTKVIYFSEMVEGKSVSIYNVSGALVRKFDGVKAGAEISLDELSDGIYFLKIKNDSGVCKLIKMQ
ncbi:MAG: T9SS type A sorting domain-containing protein [Saprospiraceae bacterium]|nr:T9SS type A sorting domain-containing protein [Candidatus Vicinibacter affinis]